MKKLIIVYVSLIISLVGLVTYFLYQQSPKTYSTTVTTEQHSVESSSSSATPNSKSQISAQLDQYRLGGSPTPLKNTVVWERLHSYILTSLRHKNFKQARVNQVINPLLEYEVELLDTKVQKILDVTLDTMIMVPRYEYDSYNNITNARFVSITQREALSALDSGALLLIHVEDPNVYLEDSSSNRIQADWLVFAD